MTTPSAPPYGQGTLADLTPSLLSAAGVEGEPNALGLDPCRGFCLLLVDGLGWEQVVANADAAPFLAGHAGRGRSISTGFPSTTSASLASLGTGLPPGQHGLVGYTMAIPGLDRPMNTLLWELYGIGPHVPLDTTVIPEDLQPAPTVFERAQADGMDVSVVGPPAHEGSPLSRAIFRGGTFRGAYFLDDVRTVIAEALDQARPAVYAYHPDLDVLGHVNGPGSEQWVEHLRTLDGLAADLAEALPEGCRLVVTGDHGMVLLKEKIDVADHPELGTRVRMVAGDARARQLSVEDGAVAEVLATWAEVLGDRAWVLPGEEAIERGWFGPTVSDRARERIGDVIAVAREPVGVFQREVDPLYASLVGHHGSLTPAERLVPLIDVGR